MAKKNAAPKLPKAPKPNPEDKKLLDALRKGLDGSKYAQGRGGMFPGGAAGDGLYKRALDEGLVETTHTPAAVGRRQPQPTVQLTERGRHYVLDVDSPRGVLEMLTPHLRTIAESLQSSGEATKASAEAPSAVQKALDQATKKMTESVEKALEKLQTAITDGFAKMEAAVVKAMPATDSNAPDARAEVVRRARAVLMTTHDVMERLLGSHPAQPATGHRAVEQPPDNPQPHAEADGKHTAKPDQANE